MFPLRRLGCVRGREEERRKGVEFQLQQDRTLAVDVTVEDHFALEKQPSRVL